MSSTNSVSTDENIPIYRPASPRPSQQDFDTSKATLSESINFQPSARRTLTRSASLPGIRLGTSPTPRERGSLTRSSMSDDEFSMIGFPSSEILIHSRLDLLKSHAHYTRNVSDRLDHDNGTLYSDDPGPRGPIVPLRQEKTRAEKRALTAKRLTLQISTGKLPLSGPTKRLRQKLKRKADKNIRDFDRYMDERGAVMRSLEEREKSKLYDTEVTEEEKRERDIELQKGRQQTEATRMRLIAKLGMVRSQCCEIATGDSPESDYDEDADTTENEVTREKMEEEETKKSNKGKDSIDDEQIHRLEHMERVAIPLEQDKKRRVEENEDEIDNNEVVRLEMMEEIPLPLHLPLLTRCPRRSERPVLWSRFGRLGSRPSTSSQPSTALSLDTGPHDSDLDCPSIPSATLSPPPNALTSARQRLSQVLSERETCPREDISDVLVDASDEDRDNIAVARLEMWDDFTGDDLGLW